MKARYALMEKAENIKRTENKIIRLKLLLAKTKDCEKKFTIRESIRAHKLIRESLLESYWAGI